MTTTNTQTTSFVPSTNSYGPFTDGRTVYDGLVYSKEDMEVRAFFNGRSIPKPLPGWNGETHYIPGRGMGDGPFSGVYFAEVPKPGAKPLRRATFCNGQEV